MPNTTNREDIEQTAFDPSNELVGKKINSVPLPKKEVGIDTDNTMFQNIIDTGVASSLDMANLDGLTNVSQRRDELYTLLDTMADDSTIAAVLETYAEDTTEYNDAGRIMWVESSNADVTKYITYLLDTINVDKHIYKWAYSLCKYGDIYLKLYRKSDFEDELFPNVAKCEEIKENKLNESLGGERVVNEDVKIQLHGKTDNYVHYLELVPNPAEMFELVKFGKTFGYIQAEVKNTPQKQDALEIAYYKYNFKKGDVMLYSATDFVHGCLEDNSGRVPEEVNVFLDDDDPTNSKNGTTGRVSSYKVRRGQSLLYSSFKVWRELTLLENSVLLNRVTKSSIIRLINVEVGDMPKESVGPHLAGIKALIEQKSAINAGTSINEYTNPGPIENNVYIPTRQGIGAISTSQVGGDVDVKGLADLDYYRDKFFGSLRVPKQYFGYTEDGAGFNGGQSLSIISSRYAKMIKRIQNTLIQTVTDAINLMLLDKGLDSYVNQFQLKMLPPTTQEELDRRDAMNNKVDVVGNVMGVLSDIDDPVAKLKALKSLLAGVLTDGEITQIIQDEIDKLTQDDASDEDMEDFDGGMDDFGGDDERPMPSRGGGPRPSFEGGTDMDGGNKPSLESPSSATDNDEMNLPSPSDLGMDMSDSEL